MKRIGFVSVGSLLLLLGNTAPIYSMQQQDKKDGERGAQQQSQQQKQPQAPQQHAQQQPQQQKQPQAPQQHAQQQAQLQQTHRPSNQGQHVPQGQQQAAWQQHRAHSFQTEHRTWQQRGGYNGYRIPDDRFRGYFGSGHAFRIFSYPLVVFDGYPSFQYGGFWFSVLDPWPEYWGADWYDTDDVYIDYSGDGYYLYNRRYPQDRIAIEVYLN